MTYSAQGVDIDRTISILQQGATTIPANEALSMIDSWQQQLQGTVIAERLGQLKQAIQQGDDAQISQILSRLGEDTLGVASDLPADLSAKVQRIGKLISESAGA